MTEEAFKFLRSQSSAKPCPKEKIRAIQDMLDVSIRIYNFDTQIFSHKNQSLLEVVVHTSHIHFEYIHSIESYLQKSHVAQSSADDSIVEFKK